MIDSNKLWHTAAEKPEQFRDIICKLKEHKYNGRIVYRNTYDNPDFYMTGVEKWFYPDDINNILVQNKLLTENIERWEKRHILDVMALKTWKKDYERLKNALEEIALGKHDKNKLVDIAIKALAEENEND